MKRFILSIYIFSSCISFKPTEDVSDKKETERKLVSVSPAGTTKNGIFTQSIVFGGTHKYGVIKEWFTRSGVGLQMQENDASRNLLKVLKGKIPSKKIADFVENDFQELQRKISVFYICARKKMRQKLGKDDPMSGSSAEVQVDFEEYQKKHEEFCLPDYIISYGGKIEAFDSKKGGYPLDMTVFTDNNYAVSSSTDDGMASLTSNWIEWSEGVPAFSGCFSGGDCKGPLFQDNDNAVLEKRELVVKMSKQEAVAFEARENWRRENLLIVASKVELSVKTWRELGNSCKKIDDLERKANCITKGWEREKSLVFTVTPMYYYLQNEDGDYWKNF